MYQMAVYHFTELSYPHKKVMEYLGCEPHGVTFTRLRKEFHAAGLVTAYSPPRTYALDRAIQNGRLVVVDDIRTWRHPHFVLVAGFTRRFYVVNDPVLGIPTLRSKHRVISSAEQALAVGMHRHRGRMSEGKSVSALL